MSRNEHALVFDLKGDYAHFKKVYTTVSQLTYGIPPRTTLSGLIAAIIGLPRDSYYNLFSEEKSKIAVSIRTPIKKQKINLNLLKTKDETLGIVDLSKRRPSRIEHIQVPFEMVKNPEYRVYVWLKEKEAFEKLEKNLSSHHTVYTPYLGITELIAHFEYQGKFRFEHRTGDTEVESVVRKDAVKIQVEERKRYVRERVPGFMYEDRTPKQYIDVVYESQGKKILIKDSEYCEINGHNVVFF